MNVQNHSTASPAGQVDLGCPPLTAGHWEAVAVPGQAGGTPGGTLALAQLSLLPPPQPLWGLGDNQGAEPPTMEPQPSQGVLWGGRQGSLWTRTPKGWLAHKLQLRILTAITFGRPIWECPEVLKNAFPLLGRFLC